MDNLIQKILSKTLREVADKLDSGNCTMSEENAIRYLDLIANVPMSKDQAYTYLNMSRASFDNYVKSGLIPHGKKIKGFKELVWYKADLEKFSNEFKKKSKPQNSE